MVQPCIKAARAQQEPADRSGNRSYLRALTTYRTFGTTHKFITLMRVLGC
jgi:hypothetical protein